MAKKKKTPEKEEKVKLFDIEIIGERAVADECDEVRNIYDQNRYGEQIDKKFQYSFIEALFLLERGRARILLDKKELTFDKFLKNAIKLEPNLWVRYCVYADLRKRGYIVKTALKFGADFRVYDRGVKPGEDHAKWIVYPLRESDVMTLYEFSAKNRVAHSTRKRLLLAVVDEESDVTYYSIAWVRP